MAETKKNWKPWAKDCYRTISTGRYWLKLKNGEECYDDFKYRGCFGWGFSGYVEQVGILEYAKF